MSGSSSGAGALAGRNVVVTGAAGFIGRRLVAALVARGAAVTAVERRAPLRSRPLHPVGAAVRRVAADLARPESLRAAIAGADVLFHLAYDIRDGAAGNLAAFDGVLAAARDGGVRRIVHASSIVVYDGWPDGVLREDQTWGSPGGGAYRQAKIAMERRLLASDIEAAILQPTLVYGSGSALWTEIPLRALASGGLVLPEPAGLAALVHAEDVAAAAVAAAELPELGHERFIVSAPPVAWEDYISGLAAIAGGAGLFRLPAAEVAARLGPGTAAADAGSGPPLAAWVSAVLRRHVGHARVEAAAGALRRFRGRAGPLWPDRFMLDLYTARPALPPGATALRLGFMPRVTLRQGLDEIGQQRR